jgi:hypothetical protein
MPILLNCHLECDAPGCDAGLDTTLQLTRGNDGSTRFFVDGDDFMAGLGWHHEGGLTACSAL